MHDPVAVPDPKNSAFFPNRKQGQTRPTQPNKKWKKKILATNFISVTYLQWTLIIIQKYNILRENNKKAGNGNNLEPRNRKLIESASAANTKELIILAVQKFQENGNSNNKWPLLDR